MSPVPAPRYIALTTSTRPSGDWGSLPLEGGIEAAYKRKLDEAPTPAARDKIVKDLLVQFEEVRNPLRTAHRFWVEEIIDPRDTRPRAIDVSILSSYARASPDHLVSGSHMPMIKLFHSSSLANKQP